MKAIVQHIDSLRFLTTVGRYIVVVDSAPEDGGGGTLTLLDQTGIKRGGQRNER